MRSLIVCIVPRIGGWKCPAHRRKRKLLDSRFSSSVSICASLRWDGGIYSIAHRYWLDHYSKWVQRATARSSLTVHRACSLFVAVKTVPYRWSCSMMHHHSWYWWDWYCYSRRDSTERFDHWTIVYRWSLCRFRKYGNENFRPSNPPCHKSDECSHMTSNNRREFRNSTEEKKQSRLVIEILECRSFSLHKPTLLAPFSFLNMRWFSY